MFQRKAETFREEMKTIFHALMFSLSFVVAAAFLMVLFPIYLVLSVLSELGRIVFGKS